jgi:glycosyltransferase involved in cell wall biosynthesis
MSALIVSICIPTFNRSRYVASLLESLVVQLEDFPYPCEIFIADNASPDTTAEVVASFSDRLPIRYHRHAENIGGYPNWQFVMSHAMGRYLVYLSDDDSILGDQVASIIAKMEADPDLVTVYAPWLLYDLVAQQEQGQFYSVPRDLRIERGAHPELLDHILRHHIFPEIQITRREAFLATMPRINDHAFLAFVHSADYLTQGAVLIQRQPFYVSITRYFDDEEREQLGTDEVEHAWDRYRGGLEYMLARSGRALSAEERSGFHLRIQQMIAVRMSVAVRLRHHKKRNPIDTYYIAMRLKGLGYEQLIPVPLSTLASEAMFEFLYRDREINRGMLHLLVVGDSSPDERAFIERSSRLPVSFAASLSVCDGVRDAVVLMRGAVEPSEFDSALALRNNLRVIAEDALLSKFGL